MYCDVKAAVVRRWSKESLSIESVCASRLEIQAFDGELALVLGVLAHRQMTPAPRTVRGEKCWRITCVVMPEEIEDVTSALQQVGCPMNVASP
jgi:hypothetical protein